MEAEESKVVKWTEGEEEVEREGQRVRQRGYGQEERRVGREEGGEEASRT